MLKHARQSRRGRFFPAVQALYVILRDYKDRALATQKEAGHGYSN